MSIQAHHWALPVAGLAGVLLCLLRWPGDTAHPQWRYRLAPAGLFFAALVAASAGLHAADETARGVSSWPQSWQGRFQIASQPRERQKNERAPIEVPSGAPSSFSVTAVGTDRHVASVRNQCRAQAWVLDGPGVRQQKGMARVDLSFPCTDATGEGLDLGDTVRASVVSVRPPRIHGGASVAVLRVRDPRVEARPWYRPLRVLRSSADRAFAAVAGEKSGRVAAAMVYGGDLQSPGAASAMKASGLSHLTSVSGANCTIIVSSAIWAARSIRRNRLVQSLAGLASIGVFVGVCGPDPTVLRAAVMGGVASIGLLVGRGRNGLALLAVAVMILLAWEPWLATDLGFALSVCATLSIILWGSPLSQRLEAVLPGIVAAPLSVTVSATIGTLPLIALISDNVPGLSIPVNLLVAPLVGPVTVLGFLVVSLAWIFPPLAAAVAWLPSRAADGIVAVANAAASHQGNQTPFPVGGAGMAAGAALWLVLAGVSLRRREPPEFSWARSAPARRSRRAVLTAASAATLALIVWLAPSDKGVLPAWQLAMCDVGQGDAVVLRADTESAVLIDAGPPDGGVADCLGRLGVREISAVYLTHLHLDHYGGLEEALRGRGQPPVFFGSLVGDERVQRLLGGLSERAVRIDSRSIRPGTVLWDSAGLKVTAIRVSPARDRRDGAAAGAEERENGASLVLLAEIGESGDPLTVLLEGDLEEDRAGEVSRGLTLAGTRALSGVDVLKVPHHGSSNGIRDAWRDLRPRVAVIGVGASNSYGHPHPKTLEDLASLGTRVKRTDQDGTITVRKERDGLVVQGSR